MARVRSIATQATSLVALSLALATASPARTAAQQGAEPSAQASGRTGGLEEIVVTATKREVGLQDVAASIQAVSGDKLRATGIGRLEDLSQLVPNFSIQKDPIGDKINIRGIQSGNNAGLEQSVATFVDGVYRGRGAQTRFAFLDPARVEVLRGPQGTLFGKNTIGGAINIVSGRPTNELSGSLAGTYTFDGVREYELEGFISGPLSDTVRARVAGIYRNLDKGWITNTFYDQTEPTSAEFAIKGTIEADLGDRTLATFRIEYGNFDQFGQPFSNRVPGPLALFGVTGNSFNSSNIGSLNPVLDIGSSGNLKGNSTEASLTVARQVGEGSLTAIAAYSRYKFNRQLDADFSLTDIVRFDDSEDFEQFSLEVRYASDVDKPFHFIAGGYFQYNTLVATGDTFFNVRGSGNELAIDTLLAGGCAFATAAGANPATDRNCILSGLVTGFDGTPLAFADFNRLLVLDQKDTVAAIFGEATYEITDTLSIIGGLRYTYERKTATQTANATDFGTRTRNDFFGASALYAPFGAPDPFAGIGEGVIHAFNLARTENAVTFSSGLQYKPSKDALFYVSASSGFKAGGFNSFALGADPAEAEYEPERALGVEIGSKLSLLDNRAEINVAAFYTSFKNIQTAIFTGSTSFIVENAAAATSKGVEVDGRWAITDNLQLSASAAFVDFRFDSFPNAACVVDQLFAYRVATNQPLATIQQCSAAGYNDLKGRTSENTPRFSATFGFSHTLPIGRFQLRTIGDVIYRTAQFREADLDPTLIQPAYAKVNLAIAFGPQSGPWEVSLVAKNLFDKNTFSYGNDSPLLEGARQFAPDRPRTVAVRARLRF
jgi:outer membrane receptor protein involved in Fe transport